MFWCNLTSNWAPRTLQTCHNVPEPGRYQPDADRIWPITALFWYIMAKLFLTLTYLIHWRGNGSFALEDKLIFPFISQSFWFGLWSIKSTSNVIYFLIFEVHLVCLDSSVPLPEQIWWSIYCDNYCIHIHEFAFMQDYYSFRHHIIIHSLNIFMPIHMVRPMVYTYSHSCANFSSISGDSTRMCE